MIVLERANTSNKLTPLRALVPFFHVSREDLGDVLHHRQMPPQPDDCPDEWYLLIKACMSHPAFRRPTAEKLVTFWSASERSVIQK